ncbi:hypothetical protein [Salinithrix halophila]|uniref:50S ribosomal protein L29 n=1 Tax=Salinithrix halophila TaxID=1485204 RepID=A0ABV8JCL2_9BACL
MTEGRDRLEERLQMEIDQLERLRLEIKEAVLENWKESFHKELREKVKSQKRVIAQLTEEIQKSNRLEA